MSTSASCLFIGTFRSIVTPLTPIKSSTLPATAQTAFTARMWPQETRSRIAETAPVPKNMRKKNSFGLRLCRAPGREPVRGLRREPGSGLRRKPRRGLRRGLALAFVLIRSLALALVLSFALALSLTVSLTLAHDLSLALSFSLALALARRV